jgi:hypothetical protein
MDKPIANPVLITPIETGYAVTECAPPGGNLCGAPKIWAFSSMERLQEFLDSHFEPAVIPVSPLAQSMAQGMAERGGQDAMMGGVAGQFSAFDVVTRAKRDHREHRVGHEAGTVEIWTLRPNDVLDLGVGHGTWVNVYTVPVQGQWNVDDAAFSVLSIGEWQRPAGDVVRDPWAIVAQENCSKSPDFWSAAPGSQETTEWPAGQRGPERVLAGMQAGLKAGGFVRKPCPVCRDTSEAGCYCNTGLVQNAIEKANGKELHEVVRDRELVKAQNMNASAADMGETTARVIKRQGL